ncbi:MAG: hypothetical protein II495_01795 [Paludibacteraceae bacterium]|nr:hypothetical protein [Paludibacteraceae bacterium]
MDNERKIPFVRPARVGNYKVWRNKTTVGKGKDKYNVEQICISDLEGVWQVRIPETNVMFAAISGLYADESLTPSLSTIFSDMLMVTSIPNGYFHRAVQMCSALYFNPDLLRDRKERKDMVKEAKKLVDDFLGWRDVYEAQVRENAPTEEQERHDEVMEEMIEETEKVSEV